MTRWLLRFSSSTALLCALCVACNAQANQSPNRPPSKPASGVDLNGVWELVPDKAAGQSDKTRVRVLAYQIRNSIQSYNIEGVPFSRPGTQVLTATDPVTSLPAEIKAAMRWTDGKGRMYWYHVTMNIDDADHLRVGGTVAYRRIERREVREIPCDERNPQHVTGLDAFRRGNAYYLLDDLATANCWFHVGAIEGDANAQASYAYSLLHARGIAQNIDEAKVWAQKSADQHNPYGEFNLIAIDSSARPSNLIQVVQGLQGLAQADDLMKRYKLHDPDAAYTGDPTAPLVPTLPEFQKDENFTMDLSGEWRMTYPGGHPVFNVVATQNGQDFQLAVVFFPTVYYYPGSIFAGHYAGGRIAGELMDAPAHKGDGYDGFAWSKAEIQVVDGATMVLPGNVQLKRTKGPLPVNRSCDAAKDRRFDPATAWAYAREEYALKNNGTAACWLYVSGSQGRPEAALALALMLHYSVGVKKDDEQSFIWMRRAADADMLDAEQLMVDYYNQGIGTKKNPELAQIWTAQVNRRLEMARQEAEQQQKQAAEDAKTAREVCGLMGMFGLSFNPIAQGWVNQKMDEGRTQSQAEARVRAETGQDPRAVDNLFCGNR